MTDPISPPNSVASAAEILARFVNGDVLTDSRNRSELAADDRAAVIAAQLLAIATQLERIADAMTPEVQP